MREMTFIVAQRTRKTGHEPLGMGDCWHVTSRAIRSPGGSAAHPPPGQCFQRFLTRAIVRKQPSEGKNFRRRAVIFSGRRRFFPPPPNEGRPSDYR
jgi:hypothetical protein